MAGEATEGEVEAASCFAASSSMQLSPVAGESSSLLLALLRRAATDCIDWGAWTTSTSAMCGALERRVQVRRGGERRAARGEGQLTATAAAESDNRVEAGSGRDRARDLIAS